MKRLIVLISSLIISQQMFAMDSNQANTDNIITLKSRLADLFLDVTIKQGSLSRSIQIGAVGDGAPAIFKGTDFEELPSGKYTIHIVRQPEGLLAAAGIRASRNLVHVTEGSSLTNAIKIYVEALEKAKLPIKPTSESAQPTQPAQATSSPATAQHELTLPVELSGDTKIVIEVQQVEVKPNPVILAYLAKQKSDRKN